jgi:hypothetical protein
MGAAWATMPSMDAQARPGGVAMHLNTTIARERFDLDVLLQARANAARRLAT